MATKLKVSVKYGVVPHKVLYSKELSLKAKGLFAYIQSKPDGWEFSADRIAEECKEERKSIQAMLRELEKSGYLVRKKSKSAEGKWYWEHQLVDEPESAFGTTVSVAKKPLKKPESAFRSTENPPTENTPINKEVENNNISISKDIDCSSEPQEESKPTFNASDWIKSLSESEQPHIRLIGYYFGLYSEHNFPTKKVANDELLKNVKPATYLLANYDKKDISKTLKYCAEKFSDVHWNLHTVKKQISYVTAKKD